MLFSKSSLSGSLLAAAVANAQNVTSSNTTSTIPSVDLLTGANCACTQLAAQYGSLVLTSNSTNYTAETINYWDTRADLLPSCIFMPTDADQISTAVNTFTSCGTQFAIRGGGHMSFPGSNNINGGVLLALNDMTLLRVAADNSSIEVGPGNRWGDVYNALAPYSLYCIGGRLKAIGVSGLALIGGFHYLANTYGLAMDNVLSYDVVLGNGTQVVANKTSNPDLFWALKGGAGNFGIVTKYTIKALPIPLVSTTIQSFDEAAIPDFIAATVDMAQNNGPDIAAGSVISLSYNITTKKASASLLGVQAGDVSPPSRFANFSAIPSVVAINNVSTPAVWQSQLDSPNQMSRIQFAHKTIKPDYDHLYNIYEAWKVASDDVQDVEGLYLTFVMNILPASALSVAKNNGVGNTWGLDDNQSYILWQLSTGWTNAYDDLRMTNWARSFVDYWHLEGQTLGLASEFLYMGDSGEFQDPFAGFPIANVQRMRSTRDLYDPLKVFSRLNWGGFKLGSA
ncbi:hypothetical protein BP5796_04308 [Coleophoma crateriformis]|uniref:FAD-binding PCMH-type domain-containing protein n=1 Tax=Coleophoma crateriformis TaxID=565419 RepID=A0A3D8SI67_9HELO|nr:hypothetical protein BP5796_04308 [Coleophoma crateriformis]